VYYIRKKREVIFLVKVESLSFGSIIAGEEEISA